MIFVKLDAAFPRHPKVAGLSVGAKWLFIESLCYSVTYQTDGWIPAAVIRELGGKPSAVDALINANLWEKKEHGFQIHNFHKHQTTKAEIAEKRHGKRIAGAKGAASRWHRSAIPEVMAKDSQNTEHRTQNLEPENSSAEADELRRCVVAFDGLMGSPSVTPPIRRQIEDWLESIAVEAKVEWFEKACAEAAASNGKSLKYVLAILRRYQAEGGAKERMNGRRESVGTDAVRLPDAFDFEEADRLREERERRLAEKAQRSVGDVRAEGDTAGSEGVEADVREAQELPGAGVRQ